MLEIAEASSAEQAGWEAFVEGSNNGTLFHSLRFLSYHEPGRVEACPLVFRDSGRIASILPGGLIQEAGGTLFASPWGGSFGGWALSGRESHEEMERLVGALVGWCRARGVRSIRLTPPPLFYHRQPDQRAEFAMLTKGFQRVSYEVTDVVPLHSGLEGVRDLWLSSARKAVRKARENQVVVAESTDLEGFYSILEDNRRRHGVRPTHTLAELRRLFELVPDRLVLLLAHREGRLLGGALLFVCNPRVVMNFYLCHSDEAGEWRPADAVMERVLEVAVERGAAYLDLGTSSLGGALNAGLHRFKGKFGARPFLRETYGLEIGSP